MLEEVDNTKFTKFDKLSDRFLDQIDRKLVCLEVGILVNEWLAAFDQNRKYDKQWAHHDLNANTD